MFKHRILVIQIMLLASGAAALAYELIWIRMLGIYFGHTIFAVSSVISALMLGLGLGSLIIGSLADRVGRPLLLYSLLELGLGGVCALMPWAFEAMYEIYLPLHAGLGDSLALRTLLQFLFGFLVLLVPAMLMGGTLPVAARALSPKLSNIGPTLSRLYGANTVGAAFGTFLAGYWLLQTLGLEVTNFVAAAINAFIGLVALFLAIRWKPLPLDEKQGEPGKGFAPALSSRASRWVLGSAFVAGAVGMSFEIGCIRSLSLIFGSSVYTMTGILLSFLVTIGFGSRLYAKHSHRSSLSVLGGLYAAASVSVFSLVLIYDKLPWLYAKAIYTWPLLLDRAIAFQGVFIAVLMAPMGLMLGAIFSCSATLVSNDVKKLGNKFGTVYFFNVLGSITGTIVATFILIPQLGMRSTLMVVCVVCILWGAGFLLTSVRTRSYLAGSVLSIYLVLLTLAPGWDAMSFISSNPYRMSPTWEDFQKESLNKEILYFEEDVSASVAVTRDKMDTISLWVNGKVDASNEREDILTQNALGNLPLLIHSNPEKVLVIGLGSGMTVEAVKGFHEPKTIDVAEISPGVVAASNYFTQGLFEDERLSLFVDDGRNHIKSRDFLYDVIISEPSNPWMAGINNLFTRDFFELAKANLAPGGVICQWLQGYDLTPGQVKLVLRTFHSVFPNMTLWKPSSNDYILIGSKDDFPIWGGERLARRLSRGQLPYEITGIKSLAMWAAGKYLLKGDEISALVGHGPLNTDDLPLLEFSAPLTLNTKAGVDFKGQLREYRSSLVPSFFRHDDKDSADLHVRNARGLFRNKLFTEARVELELIPMRMPEGVAMEGGSLKVSTIPLGDDFEGDSIIPIYHLAGVFAPPKEAYVQRRDWEFLNMSMSRLSGLAEGQGRNGGNALALKLPAGLWQGAICIPLKVEANRGYRIRLSARSTFTEPVVSGISVVAFDTAPTLRQRHSEAIAKKRRQLSRPVFPKIPTGEWGEMSSTFVVPPNADYAELFIYVDGGWGGEILIDNLSITPITQGR